MKKFDGIITLVSLVAMALIGIYLYKMIPVWIDNACMEFLKAIGG